MLIFETFFCLTVDGIESQNSFDSVTLNVREIKLQIKSKEVQKTAQLIRRIKPMTN